MALDVDLTVPLDAGNWTDGEPLVCCAVVPEAPNTATFSFVSPSAKQFRYEPGQFLTLELPVPGGTLCMRCLRPIEIFGAHMLTGIWQSRARARQGVPDELVCEDVSAA